MEGGPLPHRAARPLAADFGQCGAGRPQPGHRPRVVEMAGQRGPAARSARPPRAARRPDRRVGPPPDRRREAHPRRAGDGAGRPGCGEWASWRPRSSGPWRCPRSSVRRGPARAVAATFGAGPVPLRRPGQHLPPGPALAQSGRRAQRHPRAAGLSHEPGPRQEGRRVPSLARGWREEFVGRLFENLLAGKVAIRVVDPQSDHPLVFEE